MRETADKHRPRQLYRQRSILKRRDMDFPGSRVIIHSAFHHGDG